MAAVAGVDVVTAAPSGGASHSRSGSQRRLFALPPAARGYRRLRRRLAPRPGHCRRCGYNLAGNVSGICPECGTAKK